VQKQIDATRNRGTHHDRREKTRSQAHPREPRSR
jgi:hypothetical protein